MATFTGFGTGNPGATYSADTDSYTLATAFRVTGSGYTLTKIRLWLSSNGGAVSASSICTSASPMRAGLFAQADTGVGAVAPNLITEVTRDDTQITLDGWTEFVVGTPFALTASSVYYASIFFPFGRYVVITARFLTEVDASPIIFPASGSGAGTSGTVRNGSFNAGGFVAPTGSFGQPWYGVDVEVSDGAGGGVAVQGTTRVVSGASGVSVRRAVPAGRASGVVVPSGAGRKSAVPTGRTSAVVAPFGAARKAVAAAGRVSAVAVTPGTARKSVVATGRTSGVAVASSLRGVQVAAVVGRLVAVAGARGVARRVARGLARGSAVLVSRAANARRTPTRGTASGVAVTWSYRPSTAASRGAVMVSAAAPSATAVAVGAGDAVMVSDVSGGA